jgi:acylphosphatase
MSELSNERIVRHVIVRGRVQGVGFRAFVEHHARQRNLEGWVRNRRDGTVEAVFAGPVHAVDGMIGACKAGPPGARVDALDQREGNEADLTPRAGEKFSCRPTA